MNNQIINNDALDHRIDIRINKQFEDFENNNSDTEHVKAMWTIASPRKIETIDTGEPSGSYHLQDEHPDWGLQLRVREGVQFRSTTVDAQNSGTLTTAIHRLSDDTEDAGTVQPRPYAERVHKLKQGRQRIDLETYLRSGVYFLRRRGNDGPALRRASGYDRWDAIRSTDVPVEILRGWNLDYRPREEDNYPSYEEGNWGQNYYYFWQPRFGYGSPIDEE